ncbi:hypothetical protein PDIDSM_1179 [Penicillium digitatum]|nr:hypothetical protein PDIDSM_1179 [Penicillium digitatum]
MEARFVPLEGVNLDDSRNKAMLIVTSVFFAISLLSVILRCFVRTHVVRAWGWDDGTMVIAMALNTAFAICGIVGCKYGLGRKTVYFAQYPDHFHRAMLCWWGTTLLRVNMRGSQALHYHCPPPITIFHAYILYGAMILATAPNTHGACINRTLLIGIAYLYSIGAAITDLTIGLIPVALIWNLRMNRRTKGAIAVILGIGSMFVTPKDLSLTCMVANANILQRECRRLFGFPISPPTKIQISYVRTIILYSCHFPTLYMVQHRSRNRHHGGLFTTLRPIIRIFRDSSSDVTPQSFPLSNNVAGAFHRSMRSNQISRDDAHQLWTGTGSDEYHGVTTTISTAQKQLNSSEDDLTAYSNDPDAPRWRVERSVRVSVRNS